MTEFLDSRARHEHSRLTVCLWCIGQVESRAGRGAGAEIAVSVGHLHSNIHGPGLRCDDRRDVFDAAFDRSIGHTAHNDADGLATPNSCDAGFRHAHGEPERAEIRDGEQDTIRADWCVGGGRALDDGAGDRAGHRDDRIAALRVSTWGTETLRSKACLGRAHRGLGARESRLGFDHLTLRRHLLLEELSLAG